VADLAKVLAAFPRCIYSDCSARARRRSSIHKYFCEEHAPPGMFVVPWLPALEEVERQLADSPVVQRGEGDSGVGSPLSDPLRYSPHRPPRPWQPDPLVVMVPDNLRRVALLAMAERAAERCPACNGFGSCDSYMATGVERKCSTCGGTGKAEPARTAEPEYDPLAGTERLRCDALPGLCKANSHDIAILREPGRTAEWDPHADPECERCGHVSSDHPRAGHCSAVVEDGACCDCPRYAEPARTADRTHAAGCSAGLAGQVVMPGDLSDGCCAGEPARTTEERVCPSCGCGPFVQRGESWVCLECPYYQYQGDGEEPARTACARCRGAGSHAPDPGPDGSIPDVALRCQRCGGSGKEPARTTEGGSDD
jgi:hypothetical protein